MHTYLRSFTACVAIAWLGVAWSQTTPPPVNYQGLWWNAAESGWGVNLVHQGDQVFATWYTYDTNGKATWLSMLAPRTTPTGNTYAGAIHVDRGPPFNNFVGAGVPAPVGNGTLTFADANIGSFAYTVNGVFQTKAIARFDLATGPQPICTYAANTPNFATATNYQDLWWVANGAESGWGINFAHQGNSIFATWYTYDVEGAPLWLSALAARQGATNAYAGTIYRTSGPRYDSYNAAQIQTLAVGTATVTFANGNSAAFSYATNGAGNLPAVAQTKQLTRFAFAADGGTLCLQGTMPAPRIDSISPSQGPIAGGTVVTITGANFTSNTAVRFNRNSGINLSLVSSSQIQVTTPPLGGGIFAIALALVRMSDASGETFTEFLYRPPALADIGPGDVTTIAGVGNFVGNGRLATQAVVEAQGMAFDAAGNLYLGEENGGQVRKIDQSGRIAAIAGTGAVGFSGDGAEATDAQFNWPTGLAVDQTGNVYIADGFGNNRVRKIDAATGIVNTIAGNTQPDRGGGYGGDGGPATQAQLNIGAGSVAVDGQGNVYVLDAGNQRVRRIDTSGVITTFAGNGVAGFSGDGGLATQASFRFNLSSRPGGALALDSQGNLHVLDWENNRIRRIGTDGIVRTVVGGGTLRPNDGVVAIQANVYLQSIAVDRQDRILFVESSGIIFRVEPGGLLARLAGTGTPGLSPDGILARDARMIPVNIAVAPNGDIFVGERSAKRIRRIDATTGVLATAAGIGPATIGEGGSAALAAVFEDIGNIALDAAGNILAVEPRGSHRIRKIDPAGQIVTLAGIGVEPISGFYYEGVPALSAGISPVSVAADAGGNLLFTDFCSVRRLGNDGLIRTVTKMSDPQSQSQPCGFSGDGGPAAAAQLADEQDTLKLDSQGNVYIADLFNHRVRRVNAATGIITTFAGSGPAGRNLGGGFAGDGGPASLALLNGPSDVAFDAKRNICIADVGTFSVRCVDTQGIIRTVAGRGTASPGDGGPGTVANLVPYRIAFDQVGNMYISDYADGRIRKLDVNGTISTVAGGTGIRGFSGDGGPALQAQFDYGSGLAIDAQGNILVFDGENRRIRVIKQGAAIAH